MQECNLPRNRWLVRSRPVFKPHRTIDRPCLEKLIFHAAAKRHPCCFRSQCALVSAAESRFFIASSMR